MMRKFDQALRKTIDECIWSPIALDDGAAIEPSTLAELRDEARAMGKYDAASSAEHKRGQALGYYISRSESGAPGTFTARTREEADKQLVSMPLEFSSKWSK